MLDGHVQKHNPPVKCTIFEPAIFDVPNADMIFRDSSLKTCSQLVVEGPDIWPNDFQDMDVIIWLVVFCHPSEKHEFVTWDDEIPN